MLSFFWANEPDTRDPITKRYRFIACNVFITLFENNNFFEEDFIC